MKKYLLPLMLLISCKSTSESEVEGFADVNDTWPNPSQISVCWETSGFAQEKVFIQNAVQKAFMDVDVDFSGWKECKNAKKSDIHVVLDSKLAGGESGGFGPSRNPLTIGLKSWCGNSGVSTCLANSALHEFGHRLGLHHEMNRPDQVGCDAWVAKGDIGVSIGKFDEQSIMSYCVLNDSDENRLAVSLSAGDKATIAVVRSGVFAQIKSPQSSVTRSSVKFTINSRHASQYRFKKLSSPCENEVDYSEWRDVTLPITGVDLKNFDSGVPTTLCLLAKAKDGKEQQPTNFSSYIITIRGSH